MTGLREFTATLSISIRFVYLRIIHSSSSSKLSTKQQLLLVVKSSRKAIMKMSHILQNHYCACSSLRCGLVTITVNSAIFKVKKILRVIVVGLLFNTNQSIRLLIGQYRVFRQVLVTLPNLTKFYLTQLSFGKQTRSLICSPQG